MPYPQLYPPDQQDFHPTAVLRTLFTDAIDHHRSAAIVAHLAASTAPLRVVQLRVLGGAMARVPATATAFAHRSSRLMVNATAVYHQPEQAGVHRAWADRLAATLQGDGQARAYANFLGDEGQSRVRQAYPGGPGSGWRRSRPATTPPTCSTSTKTSHRRPRAATARSRPPGTGIPGPGRDDHAHRAPAQVGVLDPGNCWDCARPTCWTTTTACNVSSGPSPRPGAPPPDVAAGFHTPNLLAVCPGSRV